MNFVFDIAYFGTSSARLSHRANIIDRGVMRIFKFVVGILIIGSLMTLAFWLVGEAIFPPDGSPISATRLVVSILIAVVLWLLSLPVIKWLANLNEKSHGIHQKHATKFFQMPDWYWSFPRWLRVLVFISFLVSVIFALYLNFMIRH